jgi:anthranilate phosphoribosyltransferase
MSGADPVRAALRKAIAGERLTPHEAGTAFDAVMEGGVPAALLSGLLVALRMRGETVEEIAAFARAMRARALPVRSRHADLLDTCGTGGDGAGTFNVSTVAALVVAAAGVPVAKHGNRAVSGRCGSADLLEGLGVRADLSAAEAGACLDDLGFGFLFAPRLHPSMQHAAAVRRDLGVRTVFNLLGPLANPAGARRQVLGVYDAAWVEPLARVLRDLGTTRALVVHGGGTDEIALHDATVAAEVKDGEVTRRTLTPEEAGLARAPLGAIAGGDRTAQVEAARRVLEGERGPRRDIVVLNAGAALWVADRVRGIGDGAQVAEETIDRGLAAGLLERLRRRTPHPSTS